MSFETWTLEDAEIRLIDGDRGKNYPKQADFNASGHCLFLSAKNVTSSGFQFSDPVFIGKERHDLLRAGTLERGDIVMTTRGTIGNVAYYDSSVSYPLVRINSGMMIFRANQELWNTRFLYYVLTSPVIQDQITSLTSGSAVPQLPARDLKKFALPKVPLSVQNRIEAIISSLSDKLSLNQRINQTLEQMAQAIFKSWFVDFEPVKAKIAALEAGGSEEDVLLAAMQTISGDAQGCANAAGGRMPGAAKGDKLTRLQTEQPEQYAELRATAELFPSAMQDSELGEIPEGWGVKPVGEILNRLKPKRRFTKKQVAPAGSVPVFEQGTDILLGFHDDAPGFIATPEDPTFIFGDHTCITHLSCQSFDISQNVIPLKGRSRPTIWTYYALQGIQTFQEYRRHWAELIVKEVIYPPADICEYFSETVSSLIRLKEQLDTESTSLKEIRAALLPKLLSGELSVIDAEDQLTEEEPMPREEIN